MNVIELRLKDEKYVIINNGRESSVTFDKKFRVMPVNKIKFLLKNTELPVTVKIDDENGKEIISEIIDSTSKINLIK